MSKKIVIINSKPKIDSLLSSLFEELKEKNYIFYFLTNRKYFSNKYKKIYLGPGLESKFNNIFFIIFLPFLIISSFFHLLSLKYKKKVSQVIFFNINEKLIFTITAKILKLNIIWFVEPNINYKEFFYPIKILLKINARWAKQIVFNNFTKEKIINFGFKENNIKVIYPGIKLKQYKHQDTIFNNLAQSEQKHFKRKYFTIGTIVDLDCKQNIEILFQAIKICTTVIPDLQLIVVGEGEERKSLTWLARKMDIGNLVWFVGGQKHLKKWLDSFDIYIITSENICTTDLRICLEAMAIGLPVIAPKEFGFAELIKDNKNGKLIAIKNKEDLARTIINLQQSNAMRLRLNQNAKKTIEDKFTINHFVIQFEEALNS